MSIDQLYNVVMNEIAWQNFCSSAAILVTGIAIIAGIFTYRRLAKKIVEQNQEIDELVSEIVSLTNLIYRN